MKKIIYFLAALIGFAATSCQEDDVNFNNVSDLDRLPMPSSARRSTPTLPTSLTSMHRD